MTPAIIIDGKQYDNLEAMPPKVRAAFQQAMGVLADRDGSGIPDILEVSTAGTVQVLTSGGEGMSELSPEAQQKIKQALSALQSAGLIPATGADASPPPDAAEDTASTASISPLQSTTPQPPMQAMGTSRTLVALILVMGLVLCGLLALLVLTR
jgi:hypothetical protein